MVGRRPGVLEYPSGFTILHIFQAVLCMVILAVVAFTVHVIPFAGNCLMLFTASATFIVSLGVALSHISMSHAYNFWVASALDIFLFIFWIISVAVLASQTAFLWATDSDYCDTHNCSGPLADISHFYGYVFATASGLGVAAFLLVCVSLIFHGVMVCRYRRYNRVGVNVDSEPVQLYPKHYQGRPEYQPLS